MNDKTLKLSDFVKEAKSGDEASKDITDAAYWTEDIGFFQAGKTFTLNNSYTVGADGPYMEILLKENYTYFILIHDPNFFVPTTNPITVPHVLLEDTDSKSLTVYIKAIYQSMMDKPNQRCEASETYSFTACVKNSISRRIGCKLEWDVWSSPEIPLCTSVDQILQFEEEYVKLHIMQRKTLTNITGCIPPCSFTEYQLAREPLKFEETTPRFLLMLSSSDVTKRTEEIIYPMESFVSEFGGALGLFLGVSFLMILDILEFLVKLGMKSKSNLH
jgi:hypothetical protein